MQNFERNKNRALTATAALMIGGLGVWDTLYKHAFIQKGEVQTQNESLKSILAPTLTDSGERILNWANTHKSFVLYANDPRMEHGITIVIKTRDKKEDYWLVASMLKEGKDLKPKTTYEVIAQKNFPNSKMPQRVSGIESPLISTDTVAPRWYGEVNIRSKEVDGPSIHMKTDLADIQHLPMVAHQVTDTTRSLVSEALDFDPQPVPQNKPSSSESA